MKLLFDQNISFRIVKKIEDSFPLSAQVRSLNLENATDKDIWKFAKSNDFTIVTFDADFYDFSIVWGSPPKIVWLRTSDQRTESIVGLFKKHSNTIKNFVNSNEIDCLEVY